MKRPRHYASATLYSPKPRAAFFLLQQPKNHNSILIIYYFSNFHLFFLVNIVLLASNKFNLLALYRKWNVGWYWYVKGIFVCITAMNQIILLNGRNYPNRQGGQAAHSIPYPLLSPKPLFTDFCLLFLFLFALFGSFDWVPPSSIIIERDFCSWLPLPLHDMREGEWILISSGISRN